jgi:hypothetical protein
MPARRDPEDPLGSFLHMTARIEGTKEKWRFIATKEGATKVGGPRASRRGSFSIRQ